MQSSPPPGPLSQLTAPGLRPRTVPSLHAHGPQRDGGITLRSQDHSSLPIHAASHPSHPSHPSSHPSHPSSHPSRPCHHPSHPSSHPSHSSSHPSHLSRSWGCLICLSISVLSDSLHATAVPLKCPCNVSLTPRVPQQYLVEALKPLVNVAPTQLSAAGLSVCAPRLP